MYVPQGGARAWSLNSGEHAERAVRLHYHRAHLLELHYPAAPHGREDLVPCNAGSGYRVVNDTPVIEE
jgi:hypothetical protein